MQIIIAMSEQKNATKYNFYNLPGTYGGHYDSRGRTFSHMQGAYLPANYSRIYNRHLYDYNITDPFSRGSQFCKKILVCLTQCV